MPLTYEKADDWVLDVVRAAMNRWHRVLVACEVTVDVLMVDKTDAQGCRLPNALKHQGYPCAATIKVVPLPQRALGQGDALLTIDRVTWEDLTDDQRLALVDHELEHLRVACEKPSAFDFMSISEEDGSMVGSPKSDDLGRPVLKLQLHDWQLGGFRSVVARHGADALEVKAVEACVDERGQLFWDWAGIATAREVDAPPQGRRAGLGHDLQRGKRSVTLKAGGKKPRKAKVS